jgi:hypothetical protein
VRRHRGHVRAVEQDPAGGRLLEPGYQPERGRLPATGGPSSEKNSPLATVRSILSTAALPSEKSLDSPARSMLPPPWCHLCLCDRLPEADAGFHSKPSCPAA